MVEHREEGMLHKMTNPKYFYQLHAAAILWQLKQVLTLIFLERTTSLGFKFT